MKPCTSCRRHLRRAERRCPFCGAPARETAAPLVSVLSLSAALYGCTEGPPFETSSEGATSEGADSTGTSSLSGSGAVEVSTGAFEGTAVDGDETATDSASGAGFIYGDPDSGTMSECRVIEQDCPEGEKCMPWANDGGGSWNALRCVPIADNPGQPGDPCTVEGSGTSGVDDCDISAMCWDVDPETNAGTCIAMCTGTEQEPVCNDDGTTCSITNDGVLALCLPTCDPLLQDCDEGEGCYPVDDALVCVLDASEEDGAYGDACFFINTCDPGLVCLPAEVTPGCKDSGCCTEFCSLGDATGDAQCTGAPEGQQCIPFFEEGSASPEYADVGVCSLPP